MMENIYFLLRIKVLKKELEREFIEVTGKNIKIYGKDDRRKLDSEIEKYSAEKSTQMRLDSVHENLEDLLYTLLDELEYKAFQEVELNEILCAVSDFEITPKIIDLNEVGDKFFRFKMKGKMKAGKTGISYELKTSLYFLVEVENLVSSQIQVIKLDNIDATSVEDDIINIADISFEFYPEYEELDLEEEEEYEELDLEKEEEYEELDLEEEGFTVEISKESFISVFSNSKFEEDEVFLEELTHTIKNNYTVDWTSFDSKKSPNEVGNKNLFEKKTV